MPIGYAGRHVGWQTGLDMQLGNAFVRLPLQLDAARLAAEIEALGEDPWRPHPQGFVGNDALPLVAAYGDPDDDATAGPMAPTPALEACPYLRQVLASFGSSIGRSRLMRIVGDGEVQPHADISYYWWERVRVHVPLVTTSKVRFQCGKQSINMAAGECWIFDTWREHTVRNPEPTSRIHLVVDTPGSAHFWSLVAQGCDPTVHDCNELKVHEVKFVPDSEPDLLFENVNRPAVMSPWELATIAAWLEAELERDVDISTEHLSQFRHALAELTQDWRSLWGGYGNAAQGVPAYRQVLERFAARIGTLPLEDLRFSNGVVVYGSVQSLVLDTALRAEKVGASGAVGGRRHALNGPRRRLRNPIFIVNPPRSGSTLLFETLAQAPGLMTIGDESHGLIEGIPALSPAVRQWVSNRLEASDADRGTARALAAAFIERMHDRDGAVPPATGPLRLLEKTPKNVLRVPFFAEVFPTAQFVYLYRDPRETISSMLDAWHSGRFVTYPALPGWAGPPWSLLLVPGWQHLEGRSLPEIVALQWAASVEIVLQDLEKLPPDRWCVASYSKLIDEPQVEIERLCRFLGLDWDRPIESPLPLSRYTLGAPDPDKWKHNAEALEIAMPLVEKTAAKAREMFAQPPTTDAVVRKLAVSKLD